MFYRGNGIWLTPDGMEVNQRFMLLLNHPLKGYSYAVDHPEEWQDKYFK